MDALGAEPRQPHPPWDSASRQRELTPLSLSSFICKTEVNTVCFKGFLKKGLVKVTGVRFP